MQVISDEPISVEQVTPRSVFRERLRAHASANPDMSTGEVSTEVTRQFMNENPSFLEAFFIQEGKSILSWELRTDIIRTRRGIYHSLSLDKAGEPKIDSMSQVRKESVYDKMREWREFDPIANQAKLLLSFTKPMLLASAEDDVLRVLHHSNKALWKKALADGLPNDAITVEEYYEPAQIISAMNDSRKQTIQEITDGNIRIQIKPMGALPSPIAVPVKDNGRRSARSKAH